MLWENPEAITQLVDRLDMAKDVIIKTEAKEEYLNDVEKYASHLPYMTIVRRQDDLTEVKKTVRTFNKKKRHHKTWCLKLQYSLLHHNHYQ